MPSGPPPAASVAPPPLVAPDMTPVPEPPSLQVTVHLAHPRQTFDQVASLIKPLAAFFGNSKKLDLESMIDKAAGAHLGALIDLDKPVDLAMTNLDGDGDPKAVAAAVLDDANAARPMLEREYTWKQTGLGTARLELRPDVAAGGESKPCLVFPAAGTTSRLVCGEDLGTLEKLGPYVARTMGRLEGRDDVRVEVFVKRLEAAKKAMAENMGSGSSTKDTGEKLLDDVAGKLPDDVGRVLFEASFDGKVVDARMTTHFDSSQAPLTKALVGLGAPGAPPAVFDRLPHDAFAAWYGRGAVASEIAPMARLLFDGLRSWIVDDGYTESAADAAVAPLRKMLLTGGGWAMAVGSPPDRARAALDAYVDGGKNTVAARSKARVGSLGWMVAGVEEPPATWIDAWRAFVKADAARPTRKAKAKHSTTKDDTHMVITPVPPQLQLPAGTLHVEARVNQNPAWLAEHKSWKLGPGETYVPHTEHLFVVPDGSRTWLAAAEDPALAAAQVRASLGGAPSATLASRADMDVFRSAPASQGGFLTVAALASWFSGDSTDRGLKKAREALTGLKALSNGGNVPVPMSIASTPAGDGGGDVKMRLVFPVMIAAEVAASPGSIFNF